MSNIRTELLIEGGETLVVYLHSLPRQGETMVLELCEPDSDESGEVAAFEVVNVARALQVWRVTNRTPEQSNPSFEEPSRVHLKRLPQRYLKMLKTNT